MIDTICVTTESPLSLDANQSANNQDPNWIYRTDNIRHSIDGSNHSKYSAFHRNSKMRAIISNGRNLASLQASFPRLAGLPHNGFQIHCTNQFEGARSTLLQWVRHFAYRAEPEIIAIKRIDLALNLALPPRIILALHRNARHPRIRRETQAYFNLSPEDRKVKPSHRFEDLNTIRWQGTTKVITLYDKWREISAKRRPANSPEDPSLESLRVEIQLRGHKRIAAAFGVDDGTRLTLDRLDFAHCYRVFRELLLEFDHLGQNTAMKPTTAGFLAILESHPETWSILGGVPPFEWYCAEKSLSNKRLKQLRRDVAAVSRTLTPFHWADHLPEDQLPALVDIDDTGRCSLIPPRHLDAIPPLQWIPPPQWIHH